MPSFSLSSFSTFPGCCLLVSGRTLVSGPTLGLLFPCVGWNFSKVLLNIAKHNLHLKMKLFVECISIWGFLSHNQKNSSHSSSSDSLRTHPCFRSKKKTSSDFSFWQYLLVFFFKYMRFCVGFYCSIQWRKNLVVIENFLSTLFR